MERIKHQIPSISTARKILSPPTPKEKPWFWQFPFTTRALLEKKTNLSQRSHTQFPNQGCCCFHMQTQFLLVSPVIFLLAAAARGAAQLLGRLALQIHYETTISTWGKKIKKKNPTPILTQLSKTEKQPGFCSGRAKKKGCSFSGRAAPPQWDPFSLHAAFPAEQGHPIYISSPARDLQLPEGTNGEETVMVRWRRVLCWGDPRIPL